MRRGYLRDEVDEAGPDQRPQRDHGRVCPGGLVAVLSSARFAVHAEHPAGRQPRVWLVAATLVATDRLEARLEWVFETALFLELVFLRVVFFRELLALHPPFLQ